MTVEHKGDKERLIDLKDLTLSELTVYFREIGEPSYRAKQVADWIFKKGAEDFKAMTNLPADLKEHLEQYAEIGRVKILQKQVSSQGDTAKYLIGLKDGQAVETVLMRYSYGQSVCISTQAGCSMGCALCASTLSGKTRNLTSGEMYGQVQVVQEDSGQRVSHVVLMGSGEPLDNYKHTINFLKNISAEYGFNIGFRHITLSTCGIEPRIRQLAELGFPLTLAVSLHAPEDSIRSKIMPINRKYPLAVLLDACRYYSKRTGRRITFEYAMLRDINDRTEHAEMLVRLIKGIPCHVNLIPYNPVAERRFKRSSLSTILMFKKHLEKAGIEATIRSELGADIDAACGQLRRSYMSLQKNKEEI